MTIVMRDIFRSIYVTIFGKIDHLHASTEIHFLPVRESYIHALSRNAKCLTIDGQVCFYRRPFLSMLLNHEDAFLGPEGH